MVVAVAAWVVRMAMVAVLTAVGVWLAQVVAVTAVAAMVVVGQGAAEMAWAAWAVAVMAAAWEARRVAATEAGAVAAAGVAAMVVAEAAWVAAVLAGRNGWRRRCMSAHTTRRAMLSLREYRADPASRCDTHCLPSRRMSIDPNRLGRHGM